jgi:hypothetical protein
MSDYLTMQIEWPAGFEALHPARQALIREDMRMLVQAHLNAYFDHTPACHLERVGLEWRQVWR